MITVRPPFWQTPYAYFAYAVVLVLLLLLLVWLRTRLLAQRAAMLKQQVDQQTATIQQQSDNLQESLDEKNRLFSRMAHELQNPTAIIEFPLRNLLDQEKQPPSLPQPIIKQLLLAQKSLHGLQRLIGQLNDLAKSGGVEQSVWQQEEVSETGWQIVDAHALLMREHALEFNVDIDDGICAILLPDALQKILGNLLSNAIKYVPQGGKVDLAIAEKEEGKIVITVADNGPGIPEQYHQEVFRPFVRLPGSHEAKGSGIGLLCESGVA